MPEVTYCTKLSLDAKQARFLEQNAIKLNQVGRQFYVDWQIRKEKPSELIKDYQDRFGLTWHYCNGIWRWIAGMVDSLNQCIKREIADKEGQIQSAKKALSKWKKKLIASAKKASKKRNPVQPSPNSQSRLRQKIYYKQKRIEAQRVRIERLKTQPTRLIFGGKKLFKAQYYLAANGYNTHLDWKKDWIASRQSQFVCVGKGDDRQGNRSCQWFESGKLRINVPPVLRDEFGDFVELEGVEFPRGQSEIIRAIEQGKPVTHRFIHRDGNWYLHTTVEREEVSSKTPKSASTGMMGVDFNPKEVGWAITNNEGNFSASGSIPYDLEGKNKKQSSHILALVVKELVTIAVHYRVPITVEKLDFTEKKRQLREKGSRYSKMLSNFAYSKFDELLTSRCYREGISLAHRHPAWSSLIGMVKFMKRYGLSSATAAAYAMARRGQNHSERLPARYSRLLQVDSQRHVWNHWGMFKRKLVKDLPRHRFFDLETAIADQVALLEMEFNSVEKPGQKSPASSGTSSQQTTGVRSASPLG